MFLHSKLILLFYNEPSYFNKQHKFYNTNIKIMYISNINSINVEYKIGQNQIIRFKTATDCIKVGFLTDHIQTISFEEFKHLPLFKLI